MKRIQSESGFSLSELLIATGLLLVVSSIVTSALLQITNQQQTIFNHIEELKQKTPIQINEKLLEE